MTTKKEITKTTKTEINRSIETNHKPVRNSCSTKKRRILTKEEIFDVIYIKVLEEFQKVKDIFKIYSIPIPF